MTSLTADEAFLQRDIELLMNLQDYSEISAMSWEAAIQKQIEQELYPSSVEVSQGYFMYPFSVNHALSCLWCQ